MLLLAATPASAQNGGATYVPVPEITSVSCAKTCASAGRARAGGKLRVRGRNLAAVTRVVFHGGSGTADDASVRVRPRSDRTVVVAVPIEARSGPLSVTAGRDVSSARTKRIVLMPPPPPQASADLTPAPGPRDPGAPQLETGTSQAKFFLGAERRVTFFYRVSDDAAVDVKVLLVRASDGSTVRTWEAPQVPPGQINEVPWDGFDGAGQIPPEGRYAFRVVASGAGGAQVRSAQVEDVQRDAFDYYRHIFPVRGRHDYGGDQARFGAGRDGHSHQGHDVFARCGTRLVAARGGVIKAKQYHSRAGHYVVIDGDNTGVDYAYMHMVEASAFRVGDRVHTGQQIGRVGDTGHASGCHLHFEMWDAPGWYSGGDPFDPLPMLLEWDAVS